MKLVAKDPEPDQVWLDDARKGLDAYVASTPDPKALLRFTSKLGRHYGADYPDMEAEILEAIEARIKAWYYAKWTSLVRHRLDDIEGRL